MRALVLAFLLGCSSSAESSPEGAGSDSASLDSVVDEAMATDSVVDDSGSVDSLPVIEDTMVADTGSIDPPFGGTSKGSGGVAASGTVMTAGSVTYRMIAPAPSAAMPLLVVYSGTEGGATMTNNLLSLRGMTGSAGFLFAVLDGKTYFDNGDAGATVLDDVRKKYDVDNDRTYLLSESAGTRAGLKLGFHLRQSYFAAYWANDVNFADGPEKTAATLGFAPHGQSGPGGDLANATQIVTKMKAAGYRVPTPAPYDGPGSTMHGSPQQFIAAVSWFAGKTRK